MADLQKCSMLISNINLAPNYMYVRSHRPINRLENQFLVDLFNLKQYILTVENTYFKLDVNNNNSRKQFKFWLKSDPKSG